ncbi:MULTISPECIES: Gfo/Idh/MocA family oxidoreductase [unclassified Paenibacillus]|uniref:Gfo/Idh/MocA family protein n=1 Tax=unclassified Paenibacillus TaxID=185978 RepID=UPI002407598A|nr:MULTISPECIES: Gfo/Idh/MocA family oxidoreductase [unclassified Paenibacillus]MDF9841731.1 putative dehydrogenase [Paenibacillus sp. PastF-2]MDF9848157.1 putative dehydrogenase [Paenibacillus sp. PastM-2]MDF9854890.1 putative dehydrogenase [Paenibacillus sp. PastF-1]MDH6480160.1 putative dehydrogenase [Paenibacillus sp. PastH-2]MDH6507590.1 putative dehydrogenase [Paenibacillus sp. PastM-3]
MKDIIKVGIIGTGFIGPAHIEAIRRLGFVRVEAIAEHGLERAQSLAEKLSIPKAYGDYREMLNDPDIDVVHNCTPNHLHYGINKEIMQAGKHVLSEKPLAMNSEESAELLRLAKQYGIVHGVNFNYRKYPMMKQVSEMVKHGELGKVNLVHGSYQQDWLLYDTDFNWRLAKDVGGKSRAIADIGSHWCDTVQYVTGKKIVEVFSDLWTVHPIRKKPMAIGATYSRESQNNIDYEPVEVSTEDYGSVLIHLEDGSRGVFTVSQVSAGRKNRLSFELNGSQKSVFWDQEEPGQLWIGHRDQPNQRLTADPALFHDGAKSSIHHPGGHTEGWPDSIKNMMLGFYTFIREGKNPLHDITDFATFKDGHFSMCITDAILQSHEQKKWVTVQQHS